MDAIAAAASRRWSAGRAAPTAAPTPPRRSAPPTPHRKEARRRRRRRSPSAAWPRARPCSPRTWRRCWPCSPPTPRSSRPTLHGVAAGRRWPTASTPSSSTAARPPTTPCILLATGAAGPPDPTAFAAAVAEACLDLAAQMVGDAEGAHQGRRGSRSPAPPSDDEAAPAARKVAESQLVKCSWYGEDPYWGRVASELGTAGHRLRPRRAARSPTAASSVADGGVDRRRTTRPRWPRYMARRAPRGHRRPRPRRRRAPASSPTTSPTPTSTRTWEPRDATSAQAAPRSGPPSSSRRCRTSSASAGATVVVKYGGNAMVDPALAAPFAEDVVLHALGRPAPGRRARRRPADRRPHGPARQGARVPRRPAGHRRRDRRHRPHGAGRQGQPRHRRRHQRPRPARRRAVSGEDAGLILAERPRPRPRASWATSTP